MTVATKPLDLEERKLMVEERKVGVEERKLQRESWLSRNLAAVVTLTLGVITIAFNAGQSYVAYQERLSAKEEAGARGAEAAQREKEATEREKARWGMGVLELYVKYPEQFDPLKSPATAEDNLKALASVAPDVMQPILENRAGELVRKDDVQTAGAHDPAQDQALRVFQSAVNMAAQSAIRYGTSAKIEHVEKSPAAGAWPEGQDPTAYTIYMQYVGRPDVARKLADHLEIAGFRVPALDAVKSGPERPEVRYYKRNQEALAKALAADISRTLGTEARATFIGASRGNLPEGILEVWLPTPA